MTTATAARPAGTPRRHRLDVREMMTLADAGLLDGRFELVEGELIEMPPQGNPHRIGITFTMVALQRGWVPPKFISVQATHRFTKFDAPEPDLCLLESPPEPDALVDEMPRLVVEVSDTTLAVDLGRKKRDYARFGVPEYWVLDLEGRRLFVFREPNREAADPALAWRDERILKADGEVSPLCIANLTLKVADLLPATRGDEGKPA